MGDEQRNFNRFFLRIDLRIVLDDLAVARQADVAGFAVDFRADIMLQAILEAAGALNRLLHRLKNLLAVNALFTGSRVGHLQEFGAKNLHHRQTTPSSAGIATGSAAWWAAIKASVSTSFAD